MCKRAMQRNDAEVCLETITPSTEVWKFKHDGHGPVSFVGKAPIPQIPRTGEYAGKKYKDS